MSDFLKFRNSYMNGLFIKSMIHVKFSLNRIYGAPPTPHLPKAKPMHLKTIKKKKNPNREDGGKPLYKTGNSSEQKLVTAKVHRT